ncbi:uncharacterized protein LAJ45_01172 [Morchella importuna]|uniref:uncharacterized protein n=1 Tax=Morchella importuna TaxID=1174673 RepID=UPI001E8E8788|nr:uncharacterized protein LAJ45_01172 [Morchella importuna]KAH8154644.1 hypothetical protein LAJ45_01172 [Morchella importuna]
MPEAPTRPTASSFFSTPQPAREIVPEPRKRIPLALLELNGVRVNSYPTVDTPPKKAWAKITPGRITLESPPVVFGYSIPPSTRTPSGPVKIHAPGKGNRPPPGFLEGSESSRSFKKGPVFGYEIEQSDIVSDEEYENQSEEFGFGLVCRLVGKIYCDDEHEAESTPSEMVSKPAGALLTSSTNPSMITDVEYLRKEHSIPLGKREVLARNTTLAVVTSPFSSPPEFENNVCSEFLEVTGHDGVLSDPPCPFLEVKTTRTSRIPRLSHRESPISEAVIPDAVPTESNLVSQIGQPRPDDNIPIYKLISPAGVCLPLHPTPRPARMPSQHKLSKIPSALESSRDIVRFKPSPIPAVGSIPVVEVVRKENIASPESNIPVPTAQRSDPDGVVLHEFSESSLNDDEEKAKAHCSSSQTHSIPLHQLLKSQVRPVSSITAREPPSLNQFDPYLQLYSQNSQLPPLYRRRSASNPSKPVSNLALKRCASMPAHDTPNVSGSKKSRGKKKLIQLAPVRKLFDMRPPPPTPEEDKNLQYYGSRYDWWRGMRV